MCQTTGGSKVWPGPGGAFARPRYALLVAQTPSSSTWLNSVTAKSTRLATGQPFASVRPHQVNRPGRRDHLSTLETKDATELYTFVGRFADPLDAFAQVRALPTASRPL